MAYMCRNMSHRYQPHLLQKRFVHKEHSKCYYYYYYYYCVFEPQWYYVKAQHTNTHIVQNNTLRSNKTEHTKLHEQ
jgi:hypothetical protein